MVERFFLPPVAGFLSIQTKQILMNKTKNILLRVSLFDEKLIKIKAKDCGLSTSEYLRRCALNKQLPKALDSDELEVYKDLKKFYNNFNAISNLFKKGDHQKMLSEIEELKFELKNHLKKITDDK